MWGHIMLLTLTVALMSVAALTLFIAVYFMPTLIALKREHMHAKAIFSVNTLTGWTVAGWFATLSWSLRPKAP